MKFVALIFKHLRKSWIRTVSTVVAVSVCILLFCTLQTVLEAINFGLHSGSSKRLISRHSVSLAYVLPLNYKQKIAAIPGVTNTVINVWFNGIYRDPKYFFANFAVEPEAFLQVFPEIMLPEDQKQKWLHDRRGCIVGRKLAEKWSWKTGDTFELESAIPPYRIGHPFDFVIDGIYDTDEKRYPATDLSSMYFHFDYLYEATKSRSYSGIGWLTVQIADPSQAGAVSKAIDAEFENTDAPTKTETEQAFLAGFVSLAGNLSLLLNGIGLAVAFTILLVTANTMSIAVRERRQEIAVLKTLGYSGVLVMTLIQGEALLIGLAGGLVGVVISLGIVRLLPKVPVLGDVVAGFPNFGLSLQSTAIGITIALLLGLAAGFIPALMAYRTRIVDALRQV